MTIRHETPAGAAEGPTLDGFESRSLLDLNARLALVIFVVVEVAAAGLYSWYGRHQWFFYDEWDFLAGRELSVHDLLQPHAVHWTTVPIVLWRVLWSVFGLRSYLPYQALSILTHLVVAALLRVVMRRAGVGPWIATLVAGGFVLFGSGNHDILWAFQVEFTLSLAFGLVHLLLADHDGGITWQDALGVLAGLAAIMSSGVGPPMVVAVGVACLLRRGWRAALFHTVPLALVYAAWWLHYGRYAENAVGQAPLHEIVRFVVAGYRAAFDAIGAVSLIGILLVVVLVAGLSVAWRHLDRAEIRRAAAGPAGLLVAGLVFLAVTGRGRGAGAVAGYERQSRYLYVVVALCVPALAVAVQALYSRWHRLGPALVLVLVIGLPHNVQLTIDYLRVPSGPPEAVAFVNRALGQDIRPTLLALPTRPLADEAPRDLKPFRDRAPEITLGWLRDATHAGKLPADPTTADDAERADLMLSLVQSDRPTAARNCVTLREAQFRHLEPGDTLRIQGGTLRVTPTDPSQTPDEAAQIRFDPALGARLAVIAPVDVVMTSDSSQYPATVCQRD